MKESLHWIFYVYGIDIFHPRKSGIKTVFLRLCHIISIACFVSMFLIFAVSEFFSLRARKARIKIFFSCFFVFFSRGVLLLCLRSRQEAISKLLEDVSRLRRQLNIKPPYGLEKACVLFNVVFSVLSTVLGLHPFTEERYRSITLSEIHISTDADLNKSATACVAYLWMIVEGAFGTMLLTGLVSLYVILCHNLQSILSAYARRIKLEMGERSPGRHLFSCYSEVVSVLRSFESLMSFPIFVSFILSVLVILLWILRADPQNVSLFAGFEMFNQFLRITATTFAASCVNEKDKVAKEINLECLEALSKSENHANLKELAGFKRMNKSPAFLLSAWGVFWFTKSLYFSAIGCLITYSLLIKGI